MSWITNILQQKTRDLTSGMKTFLQLIGWPAQGMPLTNLLLPTRIGFSRLSAGGVQPHSQILTQCPWQVPEDTCNALKWNAAGNKVVLKTYLLKHFSNIIYNFLQPFIISNHLFVSFLKFKENRKYASLESFSFLCIAIHIYTEHVQFIDYLSRA